MEFKKKKKYFSLFEIQIITILHSNSSLNIFQFINFSNFIAYLKSTEFIHETIFIAIFFKKLNVLG